MDRFLRWLCGAQAAYFFITGVWPLLHMPSFELVTGPKVDRWLVKTVGTQVAVVGGVLALAAARDRVSPHEHPEVPLLAIGSAAGLGAIDVVYASKGRISAVYLLDAALEALLIGGWLLGLLSQRTSRLRPRTP